MAKILVGCEFSGVVRNEFAKLGHDAWSCDLIPSESEGNHLQQDILDIINDGGWNLAIFHPPCRFLAASGLHWNKKDPSRQKKTEEALDLVRKLLNAPIDKIALENSIGCISTRIRKPDQIVQPYDFGENASKATALWLKNLPLLKPTKSVAPRWVCCSVNLGISSLDKPKICPTCGKKALRRYENQCDSGQNKLGPSENRSKIRATTYKGIATQMAIQWSKVL